MFLWFFKLQYFCVKHLLPHVFVDKDLIIYNYCLLKILSSNGIGNSSVDGTLKDNLTYTYISIEM